MAARLQMDTYRTLLATVLMLVGSTAFSQTPVEVSRDGLYSLVFVLLPGLAAVVPFQAVVNVMLRSIEQAPISLRVNTLSGSIVAILLSLLAVWPMLWFESAAPLVDHLLGEGLAISNMAYLGLLLQTVIAMIWGVVVGVLVAVLHWVSKRIDGFPGLIPDPPDTAWAEFWRGYDARRHLVGVQVGGLIRYGTLISRLSDGEERQVILGDPLQLDTGTGNVDSLGEYLLVRDPELAQLSLIPTDGPSDGAE